MIAFTVTGVRTSIPAIVNTVAPRYVVTVIMTATPMDDAMKTKHVGCKHELRVAQAVNYIHEGKELCLLPLEFLSCLACKTTFILDGMRQQIVQHPSPASKKMLDWYRTEADKERTRLIVTPTEQETKLITQ